VSDLVHGVIAEVFVVPRDTVLDDTALVGELGAESIDFLDLVFRLEETFGVRIPIARWDAYVRAHMEGPGDIDRITPAFVRGFVSEILAGAEVDV
jgi:acyl carrier protein